jgi:hypothetical protein
VLWKGRSGCPGWSIGGDWMCSVMGFLRAFNN